MTFNAAHNYLGLTTEVLRTEKAINDIACHPLPASFYEGGGLRQLRQRFDGVSTTDSDNDSDYFSLPSSSTSSLPAGSSENGSIKSGKSAHSTAVNKQPPMTPFKGSSSRMYVQAGDLLSSASTVHTSETIPALTRSTSSFYTPSAPSSQPHKRLQHLSADEFDLRDEVMSCIAKSIGLLQPPLSGEESVEASPAFTPSEGGKSRSGVFKSSFGSLSLLDIGDDESSITASSTASTSEGHLSGLDNEVEILFFPAGSILAKAGDVNSGM